MRDYDKNKLSQALSKRSSMDKEAAWGAAISGIRNVFGNALRAGWEGTKGLASAFGDTLVLGPIVGAGVGGGLNYLMRPTENDRENLRKKFLIDLYRRKTVDALDRAAEHRGLEDVPDEVIKKHLTDAGWSSSMVDQITSLSNEV